MRAYSKSHSDQIGDADQIDKIAVCLADNFVKPLFDFHNEKKYQAYVKSLAEILNWSREFYKQYYQKLNDWESFEKSNDNIYNADNRNDFLIAWGCNRIQLFFAQNANETEYSRKQAKNSKNKQNNFSVTVAI